MPTLTKESIKISPKSLHRMFEAEWEDEDRVPSDYREYVLKSFWLLNEHSISLCDKKLDVTVEQIISELPLWKLPKFVWPFLMHNYKGQIIYVWRISGRVFEIERAVYNGSVVFLGKSYDAEKLAIDTIDSVGVISSDKFIKILCSFLANSFDELEKAEVDWKRYLVG